MDRFGQSITRLYFEGFSSDGGVEACAEVKGEVKMMEGRCFEQTVRSHDFKNQIERTTVQNGSSNE